MDQWDRWISKGGLVGLGLSCLPGVAVHGQVVLDGSLGPGGPLSGPDFVVEAELGQQRGGNLFHSFAQFDINAGESAVFTGPPSVSRVLARVTGGASTVDGLVGVAIAGADLFLLNEAGIAFGPNAQLAVDGSFVASTAREIELADGGRFAASPHGTSTLTTAPVLAFGFGPKPPGALRVQGATLGVLEGERFALVGGEIHLDGAIVGGVGNNAIDLVTLGETGRFVLADGTATGLAGDIDLVASSVISVGEGEGLAGRVRIQGETVNLTAGSQVFVSHLALGDAGTIDVVAETLLIDGAGVGAGLFAQGVEEGGTIAVAAADLQLLAGGQITTSAQVDGGRVVVAADNLHIDGAGLPLATGLFASSIDGTAGGVVVQGATLQLLRGGGIVADGSGGDIAIAVDDVVIDSRDAFQAPDELQLSSVTADDLVVSSTDPLRSAGRIQVVADTLTLRHGGSITARTLGSGTGGQVVVQVRQLVSQGSLVVEGLDGPLGSDIDASTFGGGSGGQVMVTASTIELASGSISSSTFADGEGGMVRVEAQYLTLGGEGSGATARINADSGGTGRGGRVEVRTGDLFIAGDGAITATALAAGDGGEITVVAERAVLDGRGAQTHLTGISTRVAEAATGQGGASTVQVAHTLEILNGATVDSGTFGVGNAGDIAVLADHLLISNAGFEAVDRPTGITSSAQPDSLGSAGDVSVEVDTLELRAGGIIASATDGLGDAGTIEVRGQTVIIDDRGNVSESITGLTSRVGPEGRGRGGDIRLEAREVTVVAAGIVDALVAGGAGPGGDIVVVAERLVLDGEGAALDDEGAAFPTGITTQSLVESQGAAGDIIIASSGVEVRGDAEINTATFGMGAGGDIRLEADTAVIQGGVVGTNSLLDAQGAGDAGNAVVLVDSLEVDDGQLSTAAARAGGGNLTVQADDVLLLGTGRLTTSVGRGESAGGNIALGTERLVALDQVAVTAQADQGFGGDIAIDAATVLLGPHVVISASSNVAGQEGSVEVAAPEVEINPAEVTLSTAYLGDALTANPCVRQASDSRFSVDIEAIAPSPTGLLFSRFADMYDPNVEPREEVSTPVNRPWVMDGRAMSCLGTPRELSGS